MTNLANKNRLTKDIVVYEEFLTPEESSKIIEILDKMPSTVKGLSNFDDKPKLTTEQKRKLREMVSNYN
jgi:hypothetical protein